MSKKTEKFAFGTEFQEELLRFTVTDNKEGYKALLLYRDSYFTLIEHAIIAKALKTYYKRKKRIASKTVLLEELRNLYNHKDYINGLLPEDKKKIKEIVTNLYSAPAKDGETLLEECMKFSRYVELKDILENVDITDFAQYDTIHRKIQKATTIGRDLKKEKGVHLVADSVAITADRNNREPAYPTPFSQLDACTDSGGTYMGNVIVVIGREKRFKTALLINAARIYLRMKKRVVYFDFENGQKALTLRMHQSLMKKSKSEIQSGEYDAKINKLLRKYKRLGAEVVIKRFPALSTTTDDLQQFIDEQYSEYGIKFDECIVDYAGKMASLSGKKDDTERISDVYVDLANFADRNQFESLWTANHTTREAIKKNREFTKWESTDTAKCIDIARHIDMMVGLNQNEEEKAAGIVRVEMVEQRNGPQEGRCLFVLDMKSQRMDEFTAKEILNYNEMIKESKKGEKQHGDL